MATLAWAAEHRCHPGGREELRLALGLLGPALGPGVGTFVFIPPDKAVNPMSPGEEEQVTPDPEGLLLLARDVGQPEEGAPQLPRPGIEPGRQRHRRQRGR